MTISHELRQITATIDYLSRKRGELLDDLKARPERHGCPYFIGQEFKTQDGAVYKVEQINVITCITPYGLRPYFQAQAVNQNKPHDKKEYTVQINQEANMITTNYVILISWVRKFGAISNRGSCF